jgi:cholesterol oxidase
MRYRLWLREPGGGRWLLRGTKLVVNEAGGGLARRVWTETTTLYVLLAPLPAGSPAYDSPGAGSSAIDSPEADSPEVGSPGTDFPDTGTPEAGSPGAGTPPAAPSYAGVVRVRPLDFLRQLASLHGEPGPGGGLRAVGRLASAFWSVVAEVYLRGGSTAGFAPGIEAAFGEPLPRPDRAPDR